MAMMPMIIMLAMIVIISVIVPIVIIAQMPDVTITVSKTTLQ